MSRAPESASATATANIMYGWLYSAGIGGSVAALFFLFLDSLWGHPLLTPSILGSVAFLGKSASSVTSVNLQAVVYFSVVHLAGFALLGLFAARLFAMVRERGGAATVITAAALFVLMQGGFFIASATVLPGVLSRLGRGSVMGANALAATAMALFLRWTSAPEPHVDWPDDRELVETPGL